MPRLRLLAVLGASLLPSLVVAQGAASAPKTYTVKKGDTLWGISKQFFSDPFLWPEIYRANTGTIEDPHWIYPGEELRIPDVASLQRRIADEAPPPPADRTSPTGPAPMSSSAAGPVRSNDYRSVYSVPHTAVRAGEYLASPWVGNVGGPSGPGVIVSAHDPRELGEDSGPKDLNLRDEVVIRPPAGVHAVRGDRFLVYRLGDPLLGHGQVVEPVGTVQVDGASDGGAVTAYVHDMVAPVRVGDGLVPLDTLVAREGAYPVAVAPVINGKVLWLQNKPLLPSIGRYLILSSSATDGLVTGDQVTLVRDRGYDAHGERLPDDILEVAQVLRVTPFGSSAIIIRVTNNGVQPGTVGRLTAKMQ